MESEILQRLYDSEINFAIKCFYDQGFSVYLGDAMNGWMSFSLDCTFAEGVHWLATEAVKHYPTSQFAKWWKEKNEN